MLKDIKIYSSDKYWNHIFAEMGADIVDSPNIADVVFDDVNVNAPESVANIKSIIFDCCDNKDIITKVLGDNVILPRLWRKIIVLLYKNPCVTMRELKVMLGQLPDVTTHTVENAIYQLRKLYGHNVIQNENGKYKIGCL